MMSILKKLKIDDILILFLLLIIYLPYKQLNFFIGHIYLHEIIFGIYFFINLILLLKKDRFKEFKETINKEKKIIIIFLFYILINFIFSLYILKYKTHYLNNLKIHINVLRGYTEFLIILFFFSFNLEKGWLGLKRYILLLIFLLTISLIYPTFFIFSKINIIKLFTVNRYYFELRNIAKVNHYIFPDGAYSIFILGFIPFALFNYKNKLLRFFLFFAIFFSIVGIFVTFSRIFLPAFLFIAFWSIFYFKKRTKIILLIIFIIFLSLSGKIIVERLISYRFDITWIGSGRFHLLNAVNNIFADNINNIFTGIGMGNFSEYSYHYIYSHIFQGFSGPHNQFFTILVDSGITGYFIFWFFIISIILKTIKNMKNDKKNKIFYFSFLGVFLSWLITSLFADMIITYFPLMSHYLFLYWGLLSILISSDRLTENK